jgi:hypothetical protein
VNHDRKVAEDSQTTRVPARAKPVVVATAGETDQVIGMQRSAGNAAVARQLAATPAPQAAGQQLGALWNELVVLPVARAYDRLSLDKPDYDSASRELQTTSLGIRTVKAATPADDKNLPRISVLEARVEGLRELIAEKRGQGKSDFEISTEMRDRRFEAEGLQPQLIHGPWVEDLRENATDAKPSEPTTVPAEAPGPSNNRDAKKDESVPELFHDLVVTDIWKGQQAFSADGPVNAHTYFLMASMNALRFQGGTPEGHPNRLKLMKLTQELTTLADILGTKYGAAQTAPLDQAADAYDFAKQMGKLLTGQPDDDEVGADAAQAGSGEPAFTWEGKENEPFVNDTALERP